MRMGHTSKTKYIPTAHRMMALAKANINKEINLSTGNHSLLEVKKDIEKIMEKMNKGFRV